MVGLGPSTSPASFRDSGAAFCHSGSLGRPTAFRPAEPDQALVSRRGGGLAGPPLRVPFAERSLEKGVGVEHGLRHHVRLRRVGAFVPQGGLVCLITLLVWQA